MLKKTERMKVLFPGPLDQKGRMVIEKDIMVEE